MSESTPSPRRSIPLVVAGAVAGVLAAGALAVGGVALYGDAKKDDHGYLSTSSHQFSANTAALTDNVDLNGTQWVADHAGTVRLRVTPQTGKPVFVGIARTRDVSAYLDGVAHTNVTDVGGWSFHAKYREHAGERRAAPPAARHIWAASAQGDTKQTVTWKPEDGKWSIVVMNADGSPGVQARIGAGAELPFLAAVGWSSVGGGLLLALTAAGLFVLAGRPPRSRPGTALAPATG